MESTAVHIVSFLKELRNFVRYGFIRVLSLHFPLILLETIFCFSAHFALCQIRCNHHKLYKIYIFFVYIAVVRYSVFSFSLICKERSCHKEYSF